MNRSIDYIITEEHLLDSSRLTIKGFLKSKAYSVQNLKQLKQDPLGILLEDQPAHLNHPLSVGDRLTINIHEISCSENILPVSLPVAILYEDEDILVVNKPAGMPIHPSQNNRDNTLANALAYYYEQKGQPFVFRCINRLDRDTSGLTVIAKHYVSAGILGCFAANKGLDSPSRSLTREYLAISRGSVTPTSGTINAPLGRKPGSIIERCIDFQSGEAAATHYHVVEEKNGYSLISLILETGRTHQIRIHLKYLGYPIVGDYLYNPDYEKIHRQALHSYRLSFLHPITWKPMDFIAPLPEDMHKLLL